MLSVTVAYETTCRCKQHKLWKRLMIINQDEAQKSRNTIRKQRRIKGFCVCLFSPVGVCLANEDESKSIYAGLIRAVLSACLDRFVFSGCTSKMDVRLVCLERKRSDCITRVCIWKYNSGCVIYVSFAKHMGFFINPPALIHFLQTHHQWRVCSLLLRQIERTLDPRLQLTARISRSHTHTFTIIITDTHSSKTLQIQYINLERLHHM